MKFISFEIKNFKGINSIILDLSEAPGLSIFSLVGLNESGKTTVLQAINMFQTDIALSERHNLIPRNLNANFTGDVSVKADLELDDDDETKIIQYGKDIGVRIDAVGHKFSVTRGYKFKGSEYEKKIDTWNIDISGPITKKSRISKQLYSADEPTWQKVVKHIAENLMPRIIYYENFLFDFPERIYLDGHIEPKQQTYKKMLQDILDSLNESLDLEQQVLERIKGASNDPAKKKALDSVLLKMSSKITDVVIKPWDSIFSAQSKGAGDHKEVQIEYGQEVTETEPPGEPRHYLSISIKQGSEVYQIEERSLGFKWFFAFLMFTQFRKHRLKDEGETLFLVDEPASNLHSSMQKRLASEVNKIVDKSKLIFTTHSHHLINPDWLEATYVVKNKAMDYTQEVEYTIKQTDVTVVPYRRFVAENPNQQDYYQPVLDALDYEPSHLEMVNPITIVEGKNDYYVYKYMDVVQLKSRYKIFLYPGNGAKGNGPIIKLYLAWGKKFNVLLDSDKEGVSAKKHYIADISKELEPIVHTLEDVKKSFAGKSIEDLFTAKEKLLVIQYLYPGDSAYDKRKFNLAMQNLLFYQHPIKLSKTTIGKFEDIFKHIKI